MTRRSANPALSPRDPPPPAANDGPVLLTVPQAARRLGVSRTMVYSLMASGRLAYVALGRCRRVQVAALADLVAGSTRPPAK